LNLNIDVGAHEYPVDDTLTVLKKSVSLRCNNIPDVSDKRIGILFSGGVDCSVLASLAHLTLPNDFQIDLFNVAFENNRILASSSYEVPDRISGRISYQELCELYPKRKFNFYPIDIPNSRYYAARSRVVSLMNPNNSVMDLSIAIALWFASSVENECRIVLVGSGADEQLGGYSRHRNAWDVGGREQLIKELQLDIDRIPCRNLGRDDRCISDQGKEARFPFLDEDVVSYLSELPIESKMDMTLPRGQGEKRLLRLVARKLGFSDQVAFLPKRAIQFGARTAKLEVDGPNHGNEKISHI